MRGVVMTPRGSTLLEVALAVALLATSGMGVVATQLSLSRHAQSTAVRGQAAFIAGAFAEMAVERGAGGGAGDQWKARAPLLIDGASVSAEIGAAVSRATVSWPAKSSNAVLQDAAVSSSRCAGAPVPSRNECVSVAFAQ